MEYADQGDLFQLITEHKKTKTHFKEEDIWNTLIQLLNGLKNSGSHLIAFLKAIIASS